MLKRSSFYHFTKTGSGQTPCKLTFKKKSAASPSSRALADCQSGQKTVFFSHLCIKCIVLPRQARDKHRENSKKSPFSRSNTAPDSIEVAWLDGSPSKNFLPWDSASNQPNDCDGPDQPESCIFLGANGISAAAASHSSTRYR